jgi:atlastin
MQYDSTNVLKSSAKNNSNWFGIDNEELTGFSWKKSINGVTKGILFWNDTFLLNIGTEKIAILLMDTQGLFEPNVKSQINARIFGLSILISSMQIINIKEKIQEDQIEYLDLATSLTQLITGKHKSARWKPFQNLLFLIRDWKNLEHGIGYEGGTQYLEMFLMSNNENTTASRIRKNIKNSYESIKCFLLNFPGEAVSNSFFLGNWGPLKPEFKDNLKILIESLLSPENVVKKSILGTNVLASELRDHIFSYVEGYRNNTMDQIGNVLEMMVDNKMNEILKKCATQYQIRMTTLDIDFDLNNFEQWILDEHNEGKRLSLQHFKKSEILEMSTTGKNYTEILENDIDEYFKVCN